MSLSDSAVGCILAVVPPQRSFTPAVHRAATYARRCGARLHLLMCDYDEAITQAGKLIDERVAERARRDFLRERSDWLAAETASLAGQGLQIDSEVLWAPDFHEAVLARVLDLPADLVLLDVETSGSGAAMHPGARQWNLLRICPVPLMLVLPSSSRLPQRVLAAVDVSTVHGRMQANADIIRAARACAQLSDAELHVGSVFSYVPSDLWSLQVMADTYRVLEEGHRAALNHLATEKGLPAEAVHGARDIDAAHGFAALAQELAADLIVVGSAYHSAVERAFFGTTTQQLLGKLHCDALIVRPREFSEHLERHLDVEAICAPYRQGLVHGG